MSTRWLAETLDDAFIRLAIRPTLPVLDSTSPLTRLRLAEARTQGEIVDDCLFAHSPLPEVQVTRVPSLQRGVRVESRSWAAPPVPLESEWGLGSVEPRVVQTEWYARSSERPLLVAISGWMPIHAIASRVLWPLTHLDDLGFDVVIPRLPTRAAAGDNTRRVGFPSADPCGNVIEVARSIVALRQTLAHAAELGYEKVVVWGASLGGYIAALLGTLAPTGFSGLVLEKPLARLSDPLRLHGRGPNAERQSVALRLDGVYRAVSPLERQPQVPSSQVHVIGARYDRVTQFENAERLAAHFNGSLETVSASHFYDLERTERFAPCLWRLVNRSGYVKTSNAR